MRIIGGAFRGIRLAEIGKGDAAAHLRPTSDRVRESIFNLLLNGGYGDVVSGARVLDLFAGTGALGLEALSRGAKQARFVENGRVALGLLARNIEICHAADKAAIIRMDATRLMANPAAGSDLIFLDPPYGKAMGQKALTAAINGGWLAPEALVVWEESAEMPTPEGFTKQDARRYGDTFVTLLTFDGPA